jgi:hypothetical protein
MCHPCPMKRVGIFLVSIKMQNLFVIYGKKYAIYLLKYAVEVQKNAINPS